MVCLQIVANSFLANLSTSATFATILVEYLLKHMEEMGCKMHVISKLTVEFILQISPHYSVTSGIVFYYELTESLFVCVTCVN